MILWPVLAQAAIPLLVLMLMSRRKRADIAGGQHDAEKSATDNEAWTLPVVLTSKNLANQFQLPVLFYVFCIVLAIVDRVSLAALIAAWLFVATRVAHAWVHVTSNYVPFRFRLYVAGFVALLALFGITIGGLASR